MSNYTSKPLEVAPVTSSINLPLIQQVLAVKQGQYSQVKQNIDQGILQLENLKVLRPEDQEYIDSKINQMYSTLDNMGDKDFSRGNVADSYYSAIKSVGTDPIVADAVGNTMKYNNFEKQMSKLAEKDASKVSSINYQFALDKAGVSDYMAGKTNKLGNFQYHAFVDVQKNLLDKVKQIKDIRGTEKVTMPDPNNPGYMIERTINGLTGQELLQVMPGLLTADEDMQIRINGWADSKNNPDGVENEFASYTARQQTKFDNEIATLGSIIKNPNKSNEEIKEAKSKLASIEKEKENFNENYASASLESKSYFLYKNNFIQTLSSNLGAREQVEYKKDEAYFANLKLEQDALKMQQDLLKAKPLGDATVTSSTATENLPDGFNAYDSLIQGYKENNDKVNNDIIGAYNSDTVDQRVKDNFKNVLAGLGYSPDGRVINQSLASKMTLTDALNKAYLDSELSSEDPYTAERVASNKILADNTATDYDRVVKDTTVELFKRDSKKYVTEFVNDLDSEAPTVRDYLQPASGMQRLQRAYSKPNSTASELDILVSSIDGNKESVYLASRTDKIKRIQNAMQKATPEQIVKFSEISGKVRDEASPALQLLSVNWVDNDLNSEAKAQAKKVLDRTAKDVVSRGRANVLTISGANTVQSIINNIPNTSETQLFDPKQSVSVFRDPSGSIVVTQNAGKGGGAKEYFKPKPTHTFGKEDDGYFAISQLIDFDESGKGLDASRAKIPVKQSSPTRFIDSSNSEKTGKAGDYLKNRIPTGYLNSGIRVRPEFFLSETSTKDAYTQILSTKYTKEVAENYANLALSKIPEMSVAMYPSDGQWSIEIKDKSGNLIKRGKTGMTNLEPQMLSLVDRYPQVIIAEYLLGNLVNNPTEILKKLNGGQ